jgi:GT2 family glycosyltransferase
MPILMATSRPPLLSVIIPTYQRIDLLALCLDCLAPGTQTLPAEDYEVIVSDDGRTAATREMMAARYPWAQWVEGPHRGPAANRNCGAAQARAAWLAFTDDDCLPRPGWLAAYAANLHAGHRVLEGRTTNGGAPFDPFTTAPTNEGGYLWSCNMAVERELFMEMGGFDNGFPFAHLEDVDFRLRLGDRGQPFHYVAGACVDHPPRPIQDARGWVRSRESSYYLARKRGVSVPEIGLSFNIYLRIRARELLHCRTPAHVLRWMGRQALEIFWFCYYLPQWTWRYRQRQAAPLVSHAPSKASVPNSGR